MDEFTVCRTEPDAAVSPNKEVPCSTLVPNWDPDIACQIDKREFNGEDNTYCRYGQVS